MSDTTEIEKKSLEAHVELCAERYRQLEAELKHANTAIETLKVMTQDVHRMVHGITDQRNTQLINWGLGLMGVMAAIIGFLVSHYVIK